MILMPLLLAFAVKGPSTYYAPLVGVQWTSCDRQTFWGDGENERHRITYTYCTSQGQISTSWVATNIRLMSGLVMGFIRSSGLRIDPMCRQNHNLEVFEISMPVLNDHQRFRLWQANNPTVDQIWALYDARASDQSVSSIMLTHHVGWDRTNFGHELSHYWYDRFCLGAQYNYEIERFAQDFEAYFNRIME